MTAKKINIAEHIDAVVTPFKGLTYVHLHHNKNGKWNHVSFTQEDFERFCKITPKIQKQITRVAHEMVSNKNKKGRLKRVRKKRRNHSLQLILAHQKKKKKKIPTHN